MKFLIPKILILLAITASNAISTQRLLHWGSENTDMLNSIALDFSDNLIVACKSWEQFDVDPGMDELILTSDTWPVSYISKFSSNGELLWHRQWDNSLQPKAVICDGNNDILLCGIVFDQVDVDPGEGVHEISIELNDINLVSTQGIVIKLSSEGEYVWSVVFEGYPSDLCLDESDNVWITGQRAIRDSEGFNDSIISEILINKFNCDGQLLLSKTFAGEDNPSFGDRGDFINLSWDGGIVVAGDLDGQESFDVFYPVEGFASVERHGSKRAFLMKMDNQGNVLWVNSWIGDGRPEFTEFVIDSHDSIFAVGDCISKIDFNPGPLEEVVDIGVRNAMFIVKCESDGSYAWGKILQNDRFGTSSYSGGLSITANHDIFCAGSYSSYQKPVGIFTVVLTSEGEINREAHLTAGSIDCGIAGVESLESGQIWLAGTFLGDLYYDFNDEDRFIHSNNNSLDCFILGISL